VWGLLRDIPRRRDGDLRRAGRAIGDKALAKSVRPGSGTQPAVRDRALSSRCRSRRKADRYAGGLKRKQFLLDLDEKGLVRVAYDSENHDKVSTRFAARLGPRHPARGRRRLDTAAREIGGVLRGSADGVRPAVGLLPLQRVSGQTVQRHLSRIAFGHTESYKEVARIVGNPKAVRAVGSACTTIPFLLSSRATGCSATDGTLGGYIGGLAAQGHPLETGAGSVSAKQTITATDLWRHRVGIRRLECHHG